VGKVEQHQIRDLLALYYLSDDFLMVFEKKNFYTMFREKLFFDPRGVGKSGATSNSS
jgi:hypothetical protein